MHNLKLGIVTDLRNYREYHKRFSAIHPCHVIEIHLLPNDLRNGSATDIEHAAKYLKEQGVERLTFHSPDNIMQKILYSEDQTEEDQRRYRLMVDTLKRISGSFQKEVFLVVHLGYKIPRSSLAGLTHQEIATLREEYLEKARKGYAKLQLDLAGSNLCPLLENSPPTCASEPSHHLIDLAFEDIAARIGENGFVFDLSHAAICVAYFKQEKEKFPALDSLRHEYGSIPFSLQSVENYIRCAAKNIRWIHLNDSNGILGENEGLALGVPGSTIDLRSVLSSITQNVGFPEGILEIVGSHNDFSLIERSYQALKKAL